MSVNRGLFQPNGRGRGAQALLEPGCGGTEGTEYLHIRFKSSAGYVLIVYAFMYALLNGYLLCSEVNVIIYARTGALGGGRTHTWRILSPLPLPLGYEGHVRIGSLLSNTCSFCSLLKDLIQHRLGEFSSKCILLAWMIRADYGDFSITITEGDLYSVCKFCSRDCVPEIAE